MKGCDVSSTHNGCDATTLERQTDRPMANETTARLLNGFWTSDQSQTHSAGLKSACICHESITGWRHSAEVVLVAWWSLLSGILTSAEAELRLKVTGSIPVEPATCRAKSASNTETSPSNIVPGRTSILSSWEAAFSEVSCELQVRSIGHVQSLANTNRPWSIHSADNSGHCSWYGAQPS